MNEAKLRSVLAMPFSCRRTTANYGLLRLYKDCIWSAPCLSTQTLQRRSLLSGYTRQCYFTPFHETQNSQQHDLHPVHRMSRKSDNKCRKYGQNLIYAHNLRMAFATPISTKPTFQLRCGQISRTDCHHIGTQYWLCGKCRMKFG